MKTSQSLLVKRGVPLVVLLVLAYSGLWAQVTQLRPVDVNKGIKNGAIHITIAPSFHGDTLKPFDGDRFNAMEILKSDSLVITLQSDSLVQIEKSKVFFWNSGSWTLEAANSLSDLDLKTGSYIKLVDSRTFSSFAWDSVSFSQRQAKCIRLKARNPVDSTILLGEWTLEGTVTFTKLLILPKPVRLLPITSLQLSVNIVDEQNILYPYFLTEPILWSSANSSIAMVDENGKLTGVAVGTTAVTAATSSRKLSGTTTVSVEQDFRPQKVAPMTIKVALVLQDPAIASQGYQRLHELFTGWKDPQLLSNKLVFHFKEATDSVVNFQFVETVNDGRLFTRYYGNFLTVSQYYNLLKEPGWKSLRAAEDSGQIRFDYREFVKFYHYDEKRNSGQIDEVWVFAAPFLGMYESQLLGPNAFWWNSPPIKDGTALTKLLSVMGLNYERGVDQAFHSFGHRTESALVQAYYQAQGRNWNPKSSNPTPWDLFTRIEKDMPGQAHVGNVHFPPNGVRDYDYGNTTIVKSYAQNWFRYPYLFDQSAQVNIATWYYNAGDPLAEGQDHLGYLRWWYNHLPRYVGVTDGVLNNWWHYVVDYEAAVELAKKTPVVGVYKEATNSLPKSFRLEQNFPNPFNPSTTIQFSISELSIVTLRVFDILGREVAMLINQTLGTGRYSMLWDARNVASGIYFYRLQANQYTETKKLVLIQ
ncbi:MAG: T9SS type A sorting domain-containing protein [Ignavibacteriales bacterium]|nr:T9SS type A sorting domain-containing protein [Ignavibacteriales bacterium]